MGLGVEDKFNTSSVWIVNSYRGLVFLMGLTISLLYFLLLGQVTNIPKITESREVFFKRDNLDEASRTLVVLAEVENANWFSYHLTNAEIELSYKGTILGKKNMESVRIRRRKTEKIEFQIPIETEKFPKMEMGADMLLKGGIQFDLRMKCKSNWIPGWIIQMEQGIFLSRQEIVELII